MVTGNSKGEGDVKGQNFLKEGMKLNWNFQRAGGMAYSFFLEQHNELSAQFQFYHFNWHTLWYLYIYIHDWLKN